jgi:hypothetical protein
MGTLFVPEETVLDPAVIGERQSDEGYVQTALRAALDKLVLQDHRLLAIGGHEQAVTHRLAVYLEPWFATYDIDCEYNRLLADPKRVKDSLVKPDIIVHRRLSPPGKDNLLIVDAKCTGNPKWKKAPWKAEELTKDDRFKYRYFACILFRNSTEEVIRSSKVTIEGRWRRFDGDPAFYHEGFLVEERILDLLRNEK